MQYFRKTKENKQPVLHLKSHDFLIIVIIGFVAQKISLLDDEIIAS
jgi:hypothetical protein